MASHALSWRAQIAAHPARAAAFITAALLIFFALWTLARAPHSGPPDMIWYGDQFGARGFEARTLGRGLLLPTREVGGQRASTVAAIENIKIPAAQFPVVLLQFQERDPAHRIAFIWRNDQEPAVTQRLELQGGLALAERVSLASHKGWRGNISGVGVQAGHPGNLPLPLMSAKLIADRLETRVETWTGATQFALSRPLPGQEALAQAYRVWPLSWITLITALVLGALAWVSARGIGAKPAVTALFLIFAALASFTELVRRAGLDEATRTASGVVLGRSAAALQVALTDTAATSKVHVWSRDGRGHEIALALAPRRARIHLADDGLPASDVLAEGDTVFVLARRGVRYLPATQMIEWESLAQVQRRAVKLISVVDGDAIFRVGAR